MNIDEVIWLTNKKNFSLGNFPGPKIDIVAEIVMKKILLEIISTYLGLQNE